MVLPGTIRDALVQTAMPIEIFRTTSPENPGRVRAGAGNSLHALDILVVERDPLLRRCLSRVLCAGGHAVVQARDAKSALCLFMSPSVTFDAALIDHVVGYGSDLGLLLGTIAVVSPAIALVIMTTHATNELRILVRSFGARALMEKPFDLHDVVTTIESLTAAPT